MSLRVLSSSIDRSFGLSILGFGIGLLIPASATAVMRTCSGAHLAPQVVYQCYDMELSVLQPHHKSGREFVHLIQEGSGFRMSLRDPMLLSRAEFSKTDQILVIADSIANTQKSGFVWSMLGMNISSLVYLLEVDIPNQPRRDHSGQSYFPATATRTIGNTSIQFYLRCISLR